MSNPCSGQRGQALTEYALMIAFIAIVVIGSVAIFGQTLINNFYTIINDGFPG